MVLGHWLRQGRECYPNKVALIFATESWTYAELDRLTDRLAASLLASGIQTGDRVSFLLNNCPELVFGYFACFKIGAIAVPLNVRMKAAELEYVINHCQARICISQSDLYPALQSIRPHLTPLEQVYLVGKTQSFPDVQPFETLLYLPTPHSPSLHLPTSPSSLLPQEDALVSWLPSLTPPPTAVAAILYTSGTTARPKGVTHTHHSLERTATFNVETATQTHEDVLGGMLPLFHIFGFTLQMLSPLSIGATLVLLPTFEPNLVLRALQQHCVTKIYGLPVMYNALVNHPAAAAYHLSHLQVGFAGGDAVPIPLQQRMKELFGVEIAEGCGMTEVIPYSMNRLGADNRLGSIGKPAVGMKLRLVGEQGQDVSIGAVGEVLVQSEAATIGYWNNPEATAELLQAGWLRTGDLARMDADGYYWFVSRRKEIIVRGGSNISPLEVEAALYQHPAVREAAVIGVPDPDWGEIVKAYVALKNGHTIAESDLREFVAERIAAYKVPTAIDLLADLPKGLTGKIHRKTLKEWTMQRARAEG